MPTAGLRNWRGEIVPSRAAPSAPSDVALDESRVTRDVGQWTAADVKSIEARQAADETVTSVADERSMPTIVLQKDEFGRDIEVVLDKHERDKEAKHARKRNHKRDKRRRDRSRSSSRRGRCYRTPLPPPDPFRPQLDERRDNQYKRRKQSRSRSRSRRRSRDGTTSHSRSSRRRGSSRSRSRSRERKHHRRSRSPAPRASRRRSSASVERKWTHSAFDDRSPSPPRALDPFYRPEPEAWVSRAGGVYVPRK